MQGLEKILEEIEQYVKVYQTPPLGMEVEGTVELLESCRDIIRKHMSGKDTNVPANDGWISVEEGMPEKEYYTALCITDKNHYCVAVYNKEYGFRTGDIDVEGEVIAWRPLPEPYQPERSIK